MFNAFERLVAFRYLRARRQEGFISVIAFFSLAGIMLGVATLIIVMAVMNGFRQELLSRILGVNGHINVSSNTRTLEDFDTIAAKIRELPGVVLATPIVEGQVMATAHNVASGALVRGLTEEDFRRRPLLIDNIVSGDLEGFDDSKSVIIGTRMAQSMRLRPGDKVTLISPRGNPSAFGTVPRMKAYPVAAIFEVGMSEYDSTFIYMPFKQAQIFFRKKGQASAIEVMTEDADRVLEIGIAIRETIGGGYRVLDWQRVNASFFTALQVERNVMFMIRQWIQKLSGTNVFNPEIYFLSRLPAKIDNTEVVTVILMALTLSFLASIVPARRAARLDPVEVLRYE